MKLILCRQFLLVIVAVLAGCAGTPTPSIDEQVNTAVAGTMIAQEAAMRSELPALVAPADGAVFDNPVGVTLEWTWERPLTPGEFYDVRVWREGEPHYGITWTEGSAIDLASWLSGQSAGDYYWTVAVIAGKDGSVLKTITGEAEPRKFTVLDSQMPTATATPSPLPSITPTPTPTSTPISEGIDLAPGFEFDTYGEAPEPDGTVITFAPDGTLYVLTQKGTIHTLEDRDGDFFAETVRTVYADPDDILTHAVGLAFHDGVMYISDSGRISTLTDADANGILDTLTPIVEGLVTLQYWDHSNNGIVFGPDGKLYVGVGATTDHGPINEPMEANILRMNPDGSALEVFATGLRNPYDLTFSPSGDLFTADNNPDQFDAKMRFLPPEELNHVRIGRNYGFPEIFGKPPLGYPSEAPVAEFYPSVATAGLVYYSADQFPPAYRDGVYVAQWGTNDPGVRARNINMGFAVVFVKLIPTGNGTYTGDWQNFVQFNRAERVIRPVDVTVGPDGALYILDYESSKVFRVWYSGVVHEVVNAEPTATYEPTQAALIAQGEAIFMNGAHELPACMTCHRLNPNEVSVGPNLRGLNAIAGKRITLVNAREYIRQSIMLPGAYLVQGYPNVMYPEYGERYTDEEVDALVEYVLTLR